MLGGADFEAVWKGLGLGVEDCWALLARVRWGGEGIGDEREGRRRVLVEVVDLV